MLGVCLDNITSKFPLYPLQGKGEMQELFQKYQSSWENRLHDHHQLPWVLPKDDIPITIRTDHL